MTIITEEMRQALAATSEPVEVLDPATNRVYVLIEKEQFFKLQSLVSLDDFEPRELYGLIEQTARQAGWDAPDMDIYDAHETKIKNGQD